MDKPLISFIVISYNQELFIREAVESALAQSYSPLEIIVIDDCSTDRSYEIAQQTAAVYKGPHSVRVCRNSSNLGIGGNINRAMELCHGALIVGSAGDDISLPTRTEVIHQAWEQSGRKATSIFTSYTAISEDGTIQEIGGTRGDPADARRFKELDGDLFEFLSTKVPVVNGCTHAWSPALFKYFGPLSSDLEDLVLSFRTLAIGKLLYIDQPLVKYRRHGNNVSFFAKRDDTRSFDHREKRLRWVDEKSVIAYDNILADIETLHTKDRIAAAERHRLRVEARRIQNYYALESRMLSGNFFDRLRILVDVVRRGDFGCALHCAPRALPRPLYRALYLLRTRWASVCG